jgi:hypothetical protein
MNIFGNSDTRRVVELSIVLDRLALAKWTKEGFLPELRFDKKKRNHIPDGPTIVIQTLPHPNGVDSIFFHQNSVLFSNSLTGYMPAFDFRFDEKYLVDLIKWETHEGYLYIIANTTSPGSNQEIARIPVRYLADLHTEGKLNLDEFPLDKQFNTFSEVHINDNPEGNLFERIDRSGRAVTYMNLLCQVHARSVYDIEVQEKVLRSDSVNLSKAGN